MAQYTALQRIELLLNISHATSETDTERLETIYGKLTEYITTTKSMLHECMLTLAETVVDQLQMTSDKDIEDSFLSDSDSSEDYYSNPESDDDLDR